MAVPARRPGQSRPHGHSRDMQQRRPRRVMYDPPQQPLAEDRATLASIPWITLRTPIRHPSLFRKRLKDFPENVMPGTLVGVRLEDNQLVGFGYYNPGAEITVRMITWGDEFPDDEFWDRKLRQALSLRSDLLHVHEHSNACRLIHAEGDGIPGVVVDRYDNVLSIEAFSLAMFQRSQDLAARLAALCGTGHFIIRTSPQSDTQEAFSARPLASPGLPKRVTVQEYGTRFRVEFEGGHKTGFFCDQRENRYRLARYCEGRSVADICCYTGGFAVQAAVLGKASEVTGVDLDAAPIELAKANANLNQSRISFVQADAFAWMRDMVRNGRTFDVVVLDPPKLIRSRSEIEDGRRAHFDLNRLALQLVAPGGLLATFTCAGLLSREEFDGIVCGAARQAGPPEPGSTDENPRRQPRDIQIIDRTGPGGDHPVAGNCPETDYLKAVWARVM